MELEDIRKLRKRLDLTQNALARLSGASQSMIAKIEGGRMDPSYSNAMRIFGALEAEMERRKESRGTASSIMARHVISVKPGERLGAVIGAMKGKSISQVPVLEGGRNVGSVSEDDFSEWFSRYGANVPLARVSEVMKEGFPVVPEDMGTESVAELLKSYKALLVGNRGRIVGIITKADLIKLMKRTV